MTSSPWRARATLMVLFGLVAIGGCKRADPATPPTRLVVFAATSLRDAFTELGTAFRAQHPEVEVAFNFAGTQELRTQLEHGAAADVFASADQRHMAELVRGARVADPVVFARGEPVIVVATEAAGRIRGLGELPSAARLVIGAPEVPIGRYSLDVLDRAAARFGADFRARVEARVVSRELNVRQVLAKVRLGEADAGIVYRTDAQAAAGAVTVVPIPSDLNVIAEYPIAVVTGATSPALAREWVSFVQSADAQCVLRAAGFLAPMGSGPAP